MLQKFGGMGGDDFDDSDDEGNYTAHYVVDIFLCLK